MNIGIFTDTYYPQINGVVTSTLALEKELINLGHTVYIFTPTDPKLLKIQEKNVYRLISMPFVFLPSNRMTLVYPPKILLTFRKLNLDIIHTQTEFSLGVLGRLVSNFHKIPSVHTYHTMYEDYVHYIANGYLLTRPMAKRYSKFFCNKANQIIVPVEKTKEALIKYGVDKPIEVIPTGLDLSKFKKENFTKTEILELKNELGIEIQKPVLLFLGRVGKEKSIDVILKQMPKILTLLPELIFVIVGEGPARNELEKMVEKLNIANSVIFTGSKPWADIGKYYQLGDVYVTASTSETQGLTYIEAMASEIPLIAKSDESLNGLVSNFENGYIFENDDELPELVCKAIKDKKLSAKIVKNALVTVDKMSSENFGKNVSNLYEKVIENYEKKKFFLFRKKKK